jgi:uncharacterized protein (TIGR03382 family)
VLWVDGARRSTSAAVNQSNLAVASQSIGEAWTDDGVFAGTYDFDDYRSDYLPLASTLRWNAPAIVAVGDCVPVMVELVDSDGNGAPATYAFDADLSLGGGGGGLFMDASCATATSLAHFAVDARSATVYLRPSVPGDVQLSTGYVDFLSTGTTVTAVSAGDAGVPANDGGAGSNDGGAGDGGFQPADPNLTLAVGCGCATLHPGLGAVAFAALVLLRRRRAKALK